MNSSIRTADSATHVRVVVVSLLAAIVVVMAGLSARTSASDATARIEARWGFSNAAADHSANLLRTPG